jgi:hemolysin D
MKLPAFTVAEPDYHDFSPPLLRLQEASPNPLGRKVLWLLAALLGLLILWALIGRLDIVAVAEGKLIPHSYLKIVQPAESGIVREILVREGERVRAGQVLMRMDTLISDADSRAIEADYRRKKATLAALMPNSPTGLCRGGRRPAGTRARIAAQYRANRASAGSGAGRRTQPADPLPARSRVGRAGQGRLVETLPHYQQQDKAFEKLVRDGFAGSLMASDKKRERIEKEQELKNQSPPDRIEPAPASPSRRRNWRRSTATTAASSIASATRPMARPRSSRRKSPSRRTGSRTAGAQGNAGQRGQGSGDAHQPAPSCSRAPCC